MNQDSRGRSKFLFVLVVAIFAVPLLLATFMYSSGIWQPANSTNHGTILSPIVNLGEELPGSPLLSIFTDRWQMIYVNEEDCAAACREALLRLRQSRLMLGNEMTRVDRVFLHGDTPPDRVFLEQHHAGLKTITDQGLQELLAIRQPPETLKGGIYLVDPLGNLVMYFAPDIEPGHMVDDIKHLLNLSRIG